MERTGIAAWAKKEVSIKGSCYIAIMPNADGYDLEVEADEGTVDSVYPTGTRSLKKARRQADLLDKALSEMGVQVFKNRGEWERHLGVSA